MNHPQVDHRKVIVEFDGCEGDHADGGWHVMWPNGDVEFICRAVEVVAKIQREDRRMAGRAGVSITVIDWRNVPAGFTPPTVAAR